jgi:hypothetical protein
MWPGLTGSLVCVCEGCTVYQVSNFSFNCSFLPTVSVLPLLLKCSVPFFKLKIVFFSGVKNKPQIGCTVCTWQWQNNGNLRQFLNVSKTPINLFPTKLWDRYCLLVIWYNFFRLLRNYFDQSDGGWIILKCFLLDNQCISLA